jgi:hypothetical protein
MQRTNLRWIGKALALGLTLAACSWSSPRSDDAANSEALDRACTPRFTLKLQDTGPKAAFFTEAMGAVNETEALVQQIGREVCRVLYRKPEEVRAANQIELRIRDYKGVAAKWGDVGDIGVQISTQHLERVKLQGHNVRQEIVGILHHEMTHMYQNDDKPEAAFPGISRMYEGIADAVRIRNGFLPSNATPSNKSGHWQDKTYTAQAFFWLFVDTAHPGFLQKLTGKSADKLWAEYQAAACCQGADRTCCR